MPDNRLLPRATASKASAVATAMLHRLADRTLVTEAAQNAAQTMGRPVWEPGGSLYAGAAGSALAFGYAARACPEASDHWWAEARDWLRLTADSTQDDPVSFPSLSNGTAGVALAVAGSDPDGRYARTLRGLHSQLAEQVVQYGTPGERGLAFWDYDVIDGPAGILGYLSLHTADSTARRVATRIIERFVVDWDSVDPRTGDDRARPGRREQDTALGELHTPDWTPWRIQRENYPPRQAEHEFYPYGYVDLGLAHGIPGPLAALSHAWLAGLRVPGLLEAVRALAEQIVAASQWGDHGRDWPRVLPFDESGAVAPHMSRRSDPVYCYGSPGVASALLDAADALDDDALRAIAVEGFEAALRRRQDGSPSLFPGLCHGDAGFLMICLKFVTQTGSTAARNALVGLVDGLLSRCDPRQDLFVQNHVSPRDAMPGSPLASATEGTWIDSPGLLEGSTGVALTLLSAATAVPPRWARALLIN